MEVLTPIYEIKRELIDTKKELNELKERHAKLLEKQRVISLMFSIPNKQHSKQSIPYNPHTINDVCNNILNAVSVCSDVSIGDIKSSSRQPHIVTARNVAAYLIRLKTKLSLSQIGIKLSSSKPKNHATMIHAIKRVKGSYEMKTKINYDPDGLSTLADACLEIMETPNE